MSAIAEKSKHARASNMDGDDTDEHPGAWRPHGLVDGAHLTSHNDMIINNSFTDAKPCTVGRWPTATDDGEKERKRPPNLGVLNGNWGGANSNDFQGEMKKDLQDSPAQVITLQEASEHLPE